MYAGHSGACLWHGTRSPDARAAGSLPQGLCDVGCQSVQPPRQLARLRYVCHLSLFRPGAIPASAALHAACRHGPYYVGMSLICTNTLFIVLAAIAAAMHGWTSITLVAVHHRIPSGDEGQEGSGRHCEGQHPAYTGAYKQVRHALLAEPCWCQWLVPSRAFH